MSYYFSTKLKNKNFDEAIEYVTQSLKEEGFGVLTTIDIQQTMKNKLGEEYPPYTILGACNPPFAHQALQAEDKIGTMLPCNVIVQQKEDYIEVSAVDPMASMQAVNNQQLGQVAHEVQQKLKKVIDHL